MKLFLQISVLVLLGMLIGRALLYVAGAVIFYEQEKRRRGKRGGE